MQWPQAVARFKFLTHAMEGTGGFAPVVFQAYDTTTKKQIYRVIGESYLSQYPRESAEKYGARNALATYENHLRSACERYVGFLGRRRPMRNGANGPLTKLLVENADLRGNDIDAFWRGFALEASARGSLLLVIDKLPPAANVNSLADQMRLRDVPYLRAALPDDLVEFEIDLNTGLFAKASLRDREYINGKLVDVTREYTAKAWRVKVGGSIVRAGEHKFGACPVIPFTENGRPFPVIGKFAQVADLSRRMFNVRSELDEILRAQTFSLLTMQVTSDSAQNFNVATAAASIGTHSMMGHSGITPAFIAPPNGPAEIYLQVKDDLQTAISRITFEDILSGKQSGTESGVSRKLRFESLNSGLSVFGKQMQALERAMWTMFHNAIGHASRVECTWPDDYNISDALGDLDALALMQATGFPPVALAEQRRVIAATLFDNADESVKAEINKAIDETAQEESKPPPEPGASIDDEDTPPSGGNE